MRTMNKKETKKKANDLLASGVAKTEVFAQLSGQGVKDSYIAHFVASYVDPARCARHDRKVDILIWLMLVQTLFVFAVGYGIGQKVGGNAKWIVTLGITSIPLLFAWGFYKHFAGAYNAYLLLSIIQLPKQLGGLATTPISTGIGLAIGVGMIAYVWYVRHSLFPDFGFISPKKVKGQYAFTD
jgi:hypothetical protein